MIPLFVDCKGKRVVIFGGGQVASRKAAFFAGDADVHVFSRSHAGSVSALPVACHVLDVKETTDAELAKIVQDSFIVIATLPDTGMNNRIGKICKRMGILFNNAAGDDGDLIIPAVSAGKQYMVAITTHGKSPAVSRYIREQIDERLFLLDEMIALQETLREELKRTEPSQQRRSALLNNVIRDQDVWDALSRSLPEAVTIARRKYVVD